MGRGCNPLPGSVSLQGERCCRAPPGPNGGLILSPGHLGLELSFTLDHTRDLGEVQLGTRDA